MEIISADRGVSFRNVIYSVLKRSCLKPSYINILLTKKCLNVYSQAFTHSTADAVNNYEYLEFLGDATINKSVAWYLTERFPHLKCMKGVKILTRLKINLISKKSFSSMAKDLNFWSFISASKEIRDKNMGKTLEDVFEAFFGATEMLTDQYIAPGYGCAVCQSIIKNLLDDYPISLKYEDLFDSKTRLKELFDHFKNTIKKLEYTSSCVVSPDDGNNKHHVVVWGLIGGKKKQLGESTSILKANAEQIAATQAIKMLNDMGYKKPILDDYLHFSSNNRKVIPKVV
jgi:dsRNA-specific ribonuclease